MSKRDDNLRSGLFGASLLGAVGAALASAACCLGPLVVSLLGVGGAGALVTLQSYRSPLLISTVALLGLGFYLVLRDRSTGPQCEQNACSTPHRRGTRRVAMAMLWTTSSLVVLVMASPYLIGIAAESATAPATAMPSAERGQIPASLLRAEIPVQGVSCSSCADGLRLALGQVGPIHEFELSLAEQTIRFAYRGDPEDIDEYVRALQSMGLRTGPPRVAAP